MCSCAPFVGHIPPMSLQNPKFPSKLKRAKMADEAELFCISDSKTVVFARLLVSVNDLHRGLSSPAFRVEQMTQNQVPQGVPVRVRPPAPQRQKKPASFRFRLAAKTARCWLLPYINPFFHGIGTLLGNIGQHGHGDEGR